MTGKECAPADLSELVDIEFAIENKVWRYGYDIYMRGRNYHLSHDKKDRYIVTGFTIEKHTIDEDGIIPSPSFTLSIKSAQSLMDELWAAGVRPSEKNLPSANTTDAIGKHLEDMRKIAFMYLGKENE